MGRLIDRITGEDLYKKSARSTPKDAPHRYRTCRDDDCRRAACAAYKEGYEDGDEDGYRRGYQAGAAAAK